MVQRAVETLCARFEIGDYNPTPIIDLGALVANADGTVDPEEIEALCQIVEPLLGARLNPEILGYLIEASLKVITAAGVQARARLIAEILMDCDAVEEGLIVALAVAHASNGLSSDEIAVITSIATAAALPPTRYDAVCAEVAKAYEARGQEHLTEPSRAPRS